jgi:hypothetical protein
MDESELIGLVKERAGLRTAREAKRAVVATLGALRPLQVPGQRLERNLGVVRVSVPSASTWSVTCACSMAKPRPRTGAPRAERIVASATSTRPGREDETLSTSHGEERRR